jgi:hypothetical protein
MLASPNSIRGLRKTVIVDVLMTIVINALLVPAIPWFIGVKPPVRLGGLDGIVGDLGKATALPVLSMTLLITLGIRARLKSRSIVALPSDTVPWLRAVPRSIVTRALVFTLLAMAVLIPVGSGVCALFCLYPLSEVGFAAVNMGYGVLISMVMTPFITLAAMLDGGGGK